MKSSLTELLIDPSERALRIFLRAIVRRNQHVEGDADEKRVSRATELLLGKKPKRGAAGNQRDDLLEMMAFDYSVEVYCRKREVSLEALAKSLIEAMRGQGKDPEGSLARDLVRKFQANKIGLLAAYSYDSAGDPSEFYRPIVEALDAINRAGIGVDWNTIPPGFRQRDKSQYFSDADCKKM